MAGVIHSLRKGSPMIAFGPEVWERMVSAVEAVRDRLRRATAALEAAGIGYSVIGGNAVAAGTPGLTRPR